MLYQLHQVYSPLEGVSFWLLDFDSKELRVVAVIYLDIRQGEVAFLIVVGITGDGEFVDPEEAKEGQVAVWLWLFDEQVVDGLRDL